MKRFMGCINLLLQSQRQICTQENTNLSEGEGSLIQGNAKNQVRADVLETKKPSKLNDANNKSRAHREEPKYSSEELLFHIYNRYFTKEAEKHYASSKIHKQKEKRQYLLSRKVLRHAQKQPINQLRVENSLNYNSLINIRIIVSRKSYFWVAQRYSQHGFVRSWALLVNDSGFSSCLQQLTNLLTKIFSNRSSVYFSLKTGQLHMYDLENIIHFIKVSTGTSDQDFFYVHNISQTENIYPLPHLRSTQKCQIIFVFQKRQSCLSLLISICIYWMRSRWQRPVSFSTWSSSPASITSVEGIALQKRRQGRKLNLTKHNWVMQQRMDQTPDDQLDIQKHTHAYTFVI